MSDVVDRWARLVAQRMSRRQLLGGLGAAAAGAAIGVTAGESAVKKSPGAFAGRPAPGNPAFSASRICGSGTVPCGAICCDSGGTCQTLFGFSYCSNSCGQNWHSQLCGGVCSDLLNDPSNCGWCGNACPPPPTTSGGTVTGVAACSNGDCAVICLSGYTACQTSGGGWECIVTSNGECPPICNSMTCNQTCCSGRCTNLHTDPFNCGSCGHVCPAPPNAVGVCTNGTCTGFTCRPGYTNCGGSCVDLYWNDANCGACGHNCAVTCPPPNGWVSNCVAGVCENIETIVQVC